MRDSGRADLVAGVDLGSNSFHMVVARVAHGQLELVDRVRERVGLAAGLTRDGRLSEAIQKRAMACLSRLGERLYGIPNERVRAVGTNTLRKAKNGREFLDSAEQVLGQPIDVISGHEEARLVYLGVAHSVADDGRRRLVVDIGGGSTECILGRSFEADQQDSLYMGCVSYTQRFFQDDRIEAGAFASALLAAQRELEPIVARYVEHGWDSCIGASGTVQAVGSVLRANGWSSGDITPKALRRLRKALIGQRRGNRLPFSGLDTDRAPVFAGGCAVLSAVFDSLRIEQMTVATGALREGLIYDLIGRLADADIRDRTIERFVATYRVDRAHAKRVQDTALELLDQVGVGWGVDAAGARRLLCWAAQLHEVGLSISFSGYHKHGAYIVANADMPGFSRDEQLLVAILIRGHRRRLSRTFFAGVSRLKPKAALRLCVLLRLAVTLNRARVATDLPCPRLTVEKDRFHLRFPRGWLGSHPLTRADLEEEASRLKQSGLTLTFQ